MPAEPTDAPQPVTALPRRWLGRTGQEVTLFGLGGEGVLRTWDRQQEAITVIQRALDQGVNYCDTAPAYAGSLDYYGAALEGRRDQVFLASKTHDRTRDGSLRLLDESLRRLNTDRLDLWQLHDLRTREDLDRIFARGGALEALLQARAEKRIRFLGITGHHDPEILLEAMRRFDFDTVLVALNAADIHRLSFIRTVLPAAARRQMGVIAMKVYAQGALLRTSGGVRGPSQRSGLSPDEALGYVQPLPGVTTAVIGCRTPAEVDENARLMRTWTSLDAETMRRLEAQTAGLSEAAGYYKKPV